MVCEVITTIVCDAMSEHCMHCPLLWNETCKHPCGKVSTLFPTTLRGEYISEWVRVSSAVTSTYAKPVEQNI